MAEPSRVLGKIAIESLTINIFSLKDAIYKFLWFVSFALKFIAIRFLPTIKGQMWPIFVIFSIIEGLILLKKYQNAISFSSSEPFALIQLRGFVQKDTIYLYQNPSESLSSIGMAMDRI